MSSEQLVLLLHPLLLAPMLIWVGYRYLPLVREAGRPRVVILILICAGLILVQVSRDGRTAYPLSTWTMYSHPSPEPVFWRVMMVGEGWEVHVPWNRVTPVREVRAFTRHFQLRAAELSSLREFDEGAGAAKADLETLLQDVALGLSRSRGVDALRALRVDRCEVDIQRIRSAADARCEAVLEVPFHAP